MVGCSLSTSPNEKTHGFFVGGLLGCCWWGGVLWRLCLGPRPMELGPNESEKPVIYCRPERPGAQKGGPPSSALSGFRWDLGPVTPDAMALDRGHGVVCCVASRRSASLLAHCCALALATSSSMPDYTARAEARSTLHQSSARRVSALIRGARGSSLLPRARSSQLL